MTADKGNIIFKTLKIREDLHRKIELLSTESRTPMYELVNDAWDVYTKPMVKLLKDGDISPEVAKLAGYIGPVEKRYRDAFELLQRLLESGDKRAIEWITGNLRMFVEALESRKPIAKQKHG